MDLEENNKKIYLAVVSLVGVLIVLIFIMLIIFIWKKPINSTNNESTEDMKLGKYSNVTFSIEEQARLYTSNISTFLSSGDYEQLFNILKKEFIEYNSFDVAKFREYIIGKKINNKRFSLKEYKTSSYNGMKIIKLNLQDENDEKFNFIVNVFESSPNDYTIAFDNFVDYIPEEKKYNIDSLEVVLYNQVYFSNEYRTSIKITNKGLNNFLLNKDKASEIIYLNQGENNDIKISDSVLLGKSLELKPNQSINYSIRFLISEFSIEQLKKIIIKDVTNEATKNTQNIEINLK